jgi:hypothetical protein
VRKTKKVKRLGLAFATLLSIVGGKTAKFDEARFLGMQFQLEAPQALCQFLLKLFGVVTILETNYNVVGVADDDYITATRLLSPFVGPKVKHVVQEDVGQKRRDASSLWSSFFCMCYLSILQHAGLQPFSDLSDDALIRDSVFNELNQPFMGDGVERKHHRLPTSMVFPAMSQLTAITIHCKGRPFSSLAGLTGKKFSILSWFSPMAPAL